MTFHDVQFPPDISYGATGGPRYQTVVVGSDSGWEQRIGSWSQARLRWEVGHQAWTDAKLANLIAFFRARKGRLHSFRFKDWSDYMAGMVLGANGPVYSTPVVLGSGTGVQTTFQLEKLYTSGAVTERRRITRPIPASVRVYLNGVDQASGWALNASTGVVTFSVAPGAGVAVAWCGQFDVPARFDSDEMALTQVHSRVSGWSVPVVEVKE